MITAKTLNTFAFISYPLFKILFIIIRLLVSPLHQTEILIKIGRAVKGSWTWFFGCGKFEKNIEREFHEIA
jgi:hypothetical protein